MKGSAWTWEQVLAVRAADRAYTRRWGKAMAAYSSPDLATVIADYNEAMAVATAYWKQDIRDALSPPEGDPF